MRKYGKVDDNQAQVVKALKRIGCSVRSLSALGLGVPDLLVGLRGQNWLMEVKDGAKCESARALTVAEKDFRDEWRGQVDTVTSAEEAVKLVTGCYAARTIDLRDQL